MRKHFVLQVLFENAGESIFELDIMWKGKNVLVGGDREDDFAMRRSEQVILG
jgi:hypothetical protein